MKNKLLLTSALVSGLVAFGATAQAETKITGDYKLSYKMASGKDAATAGEQGFGRETQINVSKSGELSNGLAYTTGFSFEADGGDTAGASGATNVVMSNEGVWLAVSSGDTTVLVGQDKAPNMDTDAVARVGEVASTGASTQATKYSRDAGTLYGSFGVALTQKVAGGSLTLNYVPQTTDAGAANNDAASNNNSKSGYEVLYKGSLGVEGLTVYLGMNERDLQQTIGNGTERSSQTNTAFGIGYNFGNIAIGANITNEEGALKSAEQQTKEIGVTMAVNDQVSVGIGRAETSDEGTNASSSKDEEVTYVQAGYNLGGVKLQASYYDISNGGWTSGNDTEVLLLRAGAAF
jgi:hypothetical protein